MSDDVIQRAAEVLNGLFARFSQQGQESLPSVFYARGLAEAGLLNPTTNPTRSEARDRVSPILNGERYVDASTTAQKAVDIVLNALGVVWAPEPRKVPARELPDAVKAKGVYPWKSINVIDWEGNEWTFVATDGNGTVLYPADHEFELLAERSPVGCREDTR